MNKLTGLSLINLKALKHELNYGLVLILSLLMQGFDGVCRRRSGPGSQHRRWVILIHTP